MQLKKWWSSTVKFFSANAIYVFHAYLFTFIAGLALVWLVTRSSLAKEVVFVLNVIVGIFVYATVFSLFIFILEYMYHIRRIKKNVFQERLILFLFAVVNFFLAILLWYVISSGISEKILELEMKVRFQDSLEGVNVTGYRYFNSTGFDVWFKTNQKVEIELSQVRNNSFYTTERFYVRRIGSAEFFTHNCHNNLDMANKALAKLLLGEEINSPSEFISNFSQSTGFEITQRLKYFQQFDSISLEGFIHPCRKISVNDFHTRKHAYGPAYITPLNDSVMMVEYSQANSSIISIVDIQTLKQIAMYEGTLGELEVIKSSGQENIFIVNRSARTVTSLHRGSGQVLTYQIPDRVLFSTIGLVSRSGFLLMSFDGQPTVIGPRFSRSRQTTILDRLTSLY